MNTKLVQHKISILEMDNIEARKFLLKGSNYFNLNLPNYFNLDFLIQTATKILSTSEIDSKNHILTPKTKRSEYQNINYTIQTNKTKSSYRPITLIHPYLYVDIINCLTTQKNWLIFTERFRFLSDISYDNIICSSIPFRLQTNKNLDIEVKSKDLALHFWQNIEQETIKLSLEYENLLKLDISNFYSSIYTHTIPWALHGEKKSKLIPRDNKWLGNKLDNKFQHMNYGETVGLPQGNIVSDLISELLLAYVDAILVIKLKKEGLTDKDYKILRYRDDYRILTNNLENQNLIKRELIVTLQRYKLSIGESKTLTSNDIINDSTTDDKKYWIEHDPVIKITNDKFYRFPKIFFNQIFTRIKNKSYEKSIRMLWRQTTHNRIYKVTLQKHLYIIKIFSDLYPNSGQLISAINEFKERISDFKYEDFENSGTDIPVLIAILVNLMKKNPKITQVGVSLLSVLLIKIDFINRSEDEQNKLKELQNNTFNISQYPKNIENYEYKFELISKILSLKHYNDYLEIWLQRIIIKNIDSNSKLIERYINESNNELVKLFNFKSLEMEINSIFNENWLKEQYRIDITKFVNISEANKLSDIISNDEISICEYQNGMLG